jgi:hypothetical protein
MKNQPFIRALLLMWAVSFLFSACKNEEKKVEPNANLTLRFEFMQGSENFALNKDFKNAFGQRYQAENLMMYLSNFALEGDTGLFKEKDSYHFVAVSRSNASPSFEIKNIPSGKYRKLVFAFGVDSVQNATTERVGDLDANGNMGWPWTQGYKFLSFEGRHFALNENPGSELVFHIGENPNYKVISLSLPESFEINSKGNVLTIKVQTEKMFSAAHQIDFTKINRVMTGPNAALLADNIAQMFVLK